MAKNFNNTVVDFSTKAAIFADLGDIDFDESMSSPPKKVLKTPERPLPSSSFTRVDTPRPRQSNRGMVSLLPKLEHSEIQRPRIICRELQPNAVPVSIAEKNRGPNHMSFVVTKKDGVTCIDAVPLNRNKENERQCQTKEADILTKFSFKEPEKYEKLEKRIRNERQEKPVKKEDKGTQTEMDGSMVKEFEMCCEMIKGLVSSLDTEVGKTQVLLDFLETKIIKS